MLAIGFMKWGDQDAFPDQLAKFEATMFEWDAKGSKETVIPMHYCTEEDLDKFWPVHESNKDALDRYKDVFQCLDMSQFGTEGLQINGNWDADEGKVLKVDLVVKEEFRGSFC